MMGLNLGIDCRLNALGVHSAPASLPVKYVMQLIRFSTVRRLISLGVWECDQLVPDMQRLSYLSDFLPGYPLQICALVKYLNSSQRTR